MRRVMWVLVLAACNNDGAAAKEPPPAPAPKLAGVYPDKWKCESIASLDALSTVLGGPTRSIDSPMTVPPGVPHPCNYEVTVGDTAAPPPAAGSGSQIADGAAQRGLEYWTFDVDCRDGMKSRADQLFAQYRQTSQDLIDAYAAAQAAAKAKPTGKRGKPGEAAPASEPPTPAVDVDVGAKGLDHHGQGLIFIDDDAPCYVRVVGRDAARRLKLARLVAKNLTFANAPMTPRAAK